MVEVQGTVGGGPAFTVHRAPGSKVRDTARWGPAVGALGVVFGDIGTSPIYTLKSVFDPGDPHPMRVDADAVYGVVSLVFWSVTIIVTVTYVLLAMRADNDGEGGIMALITLVRRWGAGHGRRLVAVLSALGIFGAALFFGDSMITPAISVLSAVEGVKVVQPALGGFVVPITVAIIVALFLVQRWGTGAVGRMFGPIMIVWFVTVAACGIAGIARRPGILAALSPLYAGRFLAGHFGAAFFALAAIVLAVTGAEALYADMGHFGRRSITRAWLVLVFPACTLSYLGQGALILADPDRASSPFFLLAPSWARLPVVLLACAATVIAAQAVITGAYSVASQAARLGYLPRLRITHTSASRPGRIYVPWVNWLLLVAVLTLVFAFRSSGALAYAFGMAVTGTITITTLLFFFLARARWHVPRWLIVVGAAPLLTVDLLFLAANVTKFAHGGWVPLLIAAVVFVVLTTWQRGREIVAAQRIRREGPLHRFVDRLVAGSPPTASVPGTAIYLDRDKHTAPLALRAMVEHAHVRHEHIVILALEVRPVPRVPESERLVVEHLGPDHDRIAHVTARYGYLETPDVPKALAGVDPAATDGPLDLDGASYFLSTIELSAGPARTMMRWRKRLFIATSYLAADAAGYFGLPRDRTVVLAYQLEV
ncbi:potassium transporter Kup [Nocardia sp. BMG111209]|uniref:potassium transporter Kup n=1 Tax=Nocardia sp. BMG111209 TaxID=1160137 RepID=UPI000477A100|nr:KUP/HAK/KT family potassium transporter [Nocardia sp. BMG111209]